MRVTLPPRRRCRAAALALGLGLVAMFCAPVAAQTWIERTPPGGPSGPLLTHASHLAYDPASNRLIVFYPSNPDVLTGPLPETWVVTHANGLGGPSRWIQLHPAGTAPTALNGGASVVYDATANRLIVYGGCFGNCSPAQATVYMLTHANGLGGTPTWTKRPVTNPQARTFHSAVFDASTGRMTSFGGEFAFPGTSQNDTRVLAPTNGPDGPATWHTLALAGPLPDKREFHTTVYDQAANRMILFGGMEHQTLLSTPHFNDTWVLSYANGLGGTPRWIRLAPEGPLPEPRSQHTAVYDPTRNQMLVFGGWHAPRPDTRQMLGDLWALSHANGLGGTPTWSLLAQHGTPPGPHSSHGAVFDAANRRMIVFGGTNAAGQSQKRVWVLVL